MLNDAIHAYRTSLAINPNQAPTWVALGETLSLAGKDEEAEVILSTAASSRPKDPWFHYILGIHRLKTGKNELAVESLEKSLGLSALPMAYHALASAHMRLGEQEKAERALQRAVSVYPGVRDFHAGIHVDLGKLYSRQGKLEAAKEEWKLALRLDPGQSEARTLLEKESQ